VTVRDADLPPSANWYSEKFVGSIRTSVVDFDSGYDQISLAGYSQDIMTFYMPLGLLRITTLPQGRINSVSQFQCAEIGPGWWIRAESEYDREEVMPGVRRHIMKHLQNLDAVLAEVKLAGGTVSGTMRQLVKEGVELVGHCCTGEGRYPIKEKIMGWETCHNQKDVRAFLGMCAYLTIAIGLKNMRYLSCYWPSCLRKENRFGGRKSSSKP
jgi:hypothetical protein